MASGGGKPWGKALFGTVTNVSTAGEVTVGFPTSEDYHLEVGDAVVLVPLPAAVQHPAGGSGEPGDS